MTTYKVEIGNAHVGDTLHIEADTPAEAQEIAEREASAVGLEVVAVYALVSGAPVTGPESLTGDDLPSDGPGIDPPEPEVDEPTA